MAFYPRNHVKNSKSGIKVKIPLQFLTLQWFNGLLASSCADEGRSNQYKPASAIWRDNDNNLYVHGDAREVIEKFMRVKKQLKERLGVSNLFFAPPWSLSDAEKRYSENGYTRIL